MVVLYIVANGDDGCACAIIKRRTPNYQPDVEKQQALQRINHWRKAAGVVEFFYSPILVTSAQNHAQYLTLDVHDGHDEDNQLNPHYTGRELLERTYHAGYQSKTAENLVT